MSGSDVFIRDLTGTGKTLGLVLAALGKAYSSETAHLQTLILVPTRDLALQVTAWIRSLQPHVQPQHMSSVVQCLVSGVDMQVQSELLKNVPKMVVGTPVRTLELFESGVLDVSRLQLLVMDEVDRLVKVPTRYTTVKEKFKANVHPPAGQILLDKIVQKRHASKDKALKEADQDLEKKKRLQVVVCSATLNHAIKRFFMQREWIGKDPALVDTTGKLQAPDTLTHYAYAVTPEGLYSLDWSREPEEVDTTQATKEETMDNTLSDWDNTFSDTDRPVLDSMVHLIHSHSIPSGFIFAHASVSIRKLVEDCQALGLDAGRLMDVTDYTHESIQGSEKRQVPKWIVLTEHEARGLDLPLANHVFILGVPSSPASYLHMSGRAGRAGRQGKVMTLLGGHKFSLRFGKMMKLLNISHASLEA